MTDIGTGSYTILGPDRRRDDGRAARAGERAAGRLRLPRSHRARAASFGANNSTSGVYAACVKLREQVAAKLGLDPTTAAFADGRVSAGGHAAPLADAVRDGARPAHG